MADIKMDDADRAVFARLQSTGRITHGLRRLMTQQWNVCSACDHSVFPGHPAFAGYGQDGAPLYVGSCCANQLTELATPSYWTGTLNLSVPEAQPLWRYMDLPKFVAMLGQRGLYFPRADTLEDKFEGAIGLARRQSDWDEYYLAFFREAVTTPPPGVELPPTSAEQIEAEAQRLLASYRASEVSGRATLVSCWHASTVESEAQWRLYSPPPVMGVAIRTTAAKLWDATSGEETAVVGRVHYVDFRQAFARNDGQRIFCKRASLSHEREVRATLQNDREAPVNGRILPCDLETLVDAVVVSPFAPAWFLTTLSEVIGRFGYRLDIRQSELLEEPFF